MPYTVNGEAVTVEHEPRLANGSMWVPLRPLAQALGAKVDYEPTTHAPIVYLGSDIITVQSGKTEVDINGSKATLASAPFIYEGDTFVPVRFFEHLPNVQVNANPNTLQVDLMQSV